MIRYGATFLLFVTASIIHLGVASAQANLVTNGGFETPDASSGPRATTRGFPTSFSQRGQWRGDPASIVAGTRQGITPFEGSQMLWLRFAGGGGATRFGGCDR